MTELLLSRQLSQHDYRRFRGLVLERTGLDIGPRRRETLVNGVLDGAARARCEDLEQYFTLLKITQTNDSLWDDLICKLTVGETYFFRNPSHIEALCSHILPDLLYRHRKEKRLRIWSAGCSTGEEAYTIAIILRRILPEIDDWNVLILATDINRDSLKKAQTGHYREWSFRQSHPTVKKMYFKKNGDTYEILPKVREMVSFAYLNLADGSFPSLITNTNAMDLILCRNVFIYLPKLATAEITNHFYQCLSPGGWLVVGASETNHKTYRQFVTRDIGAATVYQKDTARPTDMPGDDLEKVTNLTKKIHKAAPPSSAPTLPRISPPASKPAEQEGYPRSPVPEIPSKPSIPKPPTPTEVYQTGLDYYASGQFEEAIHKFLSVVETNPDIEMAYYQMARIRANQGRLEEAQSWCQLVLDRAPELLEAHYTLALIYIEENMPDQAIKQFKKVLYLNPDYLLAHFGLGTLYQKIDHPEKASRHFTWAIRLAGRISPEEEVPGSDELTAGQLINMINTSRRFSSS